MAINTSSFPYAFLKEPGGLLRPIGTTVASQIPRGYAINDAGQVAGAFIDESGQNLHPFLWRNGKISDLGVSPGAVSSSATGIDSAGRVLVQSTDTSGVVSCAVWTNGVYTNLVGVNGNCGAIASVGSGAIVAGTCGSGNVYNACIWNVP